MFSRMMSAGERLTQGTSFTEDDLRLLETLANQAAAALENGQLEQSLAELSRLKEELRHQAYHDPLTGLGNRSLFAEQVDARLARPGPGLLPVVLFIDLDDFKVINDTFGHQEGDVVLRTVARRLVALIRDEDTAGRFGGVEFTLLCEGTDARGAELVAERVAAEIETPITLSDGSAAS